MLIGRIGDLLPSSIHNLLFRQPFIVGQYQPDAQARESVTSTTTHRFKVDKALPPGLTTAYLPFAVFNK
jgi:hypothetical protein